MQGALPWSLPFSLAVFVVAALAIAGAGVMIVARAERLAEVTGLGQALMGAVFIGVTTSLADLSTSVTAAYQGYAQLAVSNAVGGIAAQTVFLGVADITYRRANLEHAAASEANLLQAGLLIVLLAIALLAMLGPSVSVLGVHPASLGMLAAYFLGMRMVATVRDAPMWYPRRTAETQPAERKDRTETRGGLLRAWSAFFALAAVIAVAGWSLAEAGIGIVHHTGLSETLVGTLFTAISTSLPELVVAVSAVRRGALTLAVGDIIGGNSFDALFIAAADLVYPTGSIYHHVGPEQAFWLGLNILLTAILLLGLLRRERHGIGNIGFESFFILLLYLGAAILLF